MYLIGITGMIASGKSYVAKLYKEMGAYLLDADKIGHKLLNSNAIKKRIADAFGKEIFGDKGAIDRQKLADIVFCNKEKLMQLDDIMEKPITSVLRERIMELEDTGFPGIIAIDAALLPRWDLRNVMDMILLVEAPKWQLKNRLVRQRGLPADDAERRISAQDKLFENFHPKKSIVIKNNGDFIELRSNAMKVWMQIKELAQKKEELQK